MDSLSSISTCRPAPTDRAGEAGASATGAGSSTQSDLVVVASLRRSIADDFASFVNENVRAETILVRNGELERLENIHPGPDRVASLVLFLAPNLDDADLRALAELLDATRHWPVRFVGLVSTFRIHLEDPVAEQTERSAMALVREKGPRCRLAVFRPGLVLSPRARLTSWLKRLAPLYPLVPTRVRTCFLEGTELFTAIEANRCEDDLSPPVPAGRAVGRRDRVYTLLGENTSWREMLRRHRSVSLGARLTSACASVLSWLLLGEAVAWAASLVAGRSWSVRTLKPRSMSELLSLCHRGNIDRVRVVGYNNGVNHFGHQYPGKTIVSTVRCRRTAHAGPGRLKADCGATMRDARDYLDGRGEELYVMPNYSYVSLGTTFFVPVHGSAVDYATVAETVERVVLYEPDQDRIVSAARADEDFRDTVYNLRSRAVVLRLYLRTKPKSRYFVHREVWKSPEADKLLETFRERGAANVEARQGHAASANVTVSRYFTEPPTGSSSAALELPRDALGRLWDRLEENPGTSFLMHALSRRVAWHTELFMTPSEFDLFWRTHAQVPLRKIQLRYIRRDGMPHSPFRDEDCVSADLFLFRPDKPAFDSYLKQYFPGIRFNPGKHSN
jgi:hypothetical protein